ncbi:hypothetical protein PVAND_006490 [Polypedilum vanderplanki]|uniref:Neurotransmitter-gated ion-channel ligand-binding domain-containing protein n=1 Tax=Polypedilum vanderplanki TaxID=319348 RepID=A0A9J6C484_POLVA|nr:hypothetical protein PVAND_006490 [Polypedilum vanderplanki]
MKISIGIFLLIFLAKIKISEQLTCDRRENEINLQRKLKNDLFCKYDKNIRPGNTKEITSINVRLNIKDLDYEDQKNTMTIESWMTLTWNDSKLNWNPSDYGNIQSINMKQDYLWTPDLKLYNSHIPSSLGTCHLVDCLIKYTSVVACVMPCSHTAHCKNFGISNWPYDIQNCSFTFGSWMKTGEELNYNEERIKIVTSRLKKNNQWNLISASSRYNKGVYSILNETFPSVTFTLVIERHNGLHQVTSISSAVVLMIANLLVLCVAPEKIVRLIFVIINLASISLFIDFLYWMLPYPGDMLPKVFIFFGDLQLYTLLLLIETLFIKAYLENLEKPSEWIITITKFTKSNFILAAVLSENTKKLPENADDLIENVEHEKTAKEVRKSFCLLIDRTLTIITVVIFSFMFFTLFPKGYLSSNYNPIESLS